MPRTRIPWTEIEPILRDRAYRRLDSDPNVLLEGDAWLSVDADVYYARLLGYEDEVVQDAMRIHTALPEIYVPIPRRFVWPGPDEIALGLYKIDDTEVWMPPSIPQLHADRAVYRSQSVFVTLDVSCELYEPPVEKVRPDMTVRIAYLRYRRRS